MIRPQFSLRSLVAVLTLAACAFGVGLPAYREYQRQRIVNLIRGEVEKGLALAESQAVENPETALLEMQVLRESIRLAPSLTDADRQEFEPRFELLRMDCARQIKINDSERWMYSCGVRSDAAVILGAATNLAP
jgi:hypothetical protein